MLMRINLSETFFRPTPFSSLKIWLFDENIIPEPAMMLFQEDSLQNHRNFKSSLSTFIFCSQVCMFGHVLWAYCIYMWVFVCLCVCVCVRVCVCVGGWV